MIAKSAHNQSSQHPKLAMFSLIYFCRSSNSELIIEAWLKNNHSTGHCGHFDLQKISYIHMLKLCLRATWMRVEQASALTIQRGIARFLCGKTGTWQL
jgi:hypothetical protein